MARHGDPLIVHAFLSSPGDVPEEWAAARDLLKTEIEYHPLLRNKVLLHVTSWDDPAAPAPMTPTQTPQQSVNRFKRRPGQCDIVVVMLAGRLCRTAMAAAPNSGRDQWVDLYRVHWRFAFASAVWSRFCRYDCTVSGRSPSC